MKNIINNIKNIERNFKVNKKTDLSISNMIWKMIDEMPNYNIQNLRKDIKNETTVRYN